MLKVKKNKVVYLNSMTLILPNKKEWFGYQMSWSAKRSIRRDYLLLIWKGKNDFFFFFSKLTEHHIAKKGSYTTKFKKKKKKKIQLIFKISLE